MVSLTSLLLLILSILFNFNSIELLNLVRLVASSFGGSQAEECGEVRKLAHYSLDGKEQSALI